jgi:hypothetical protein
MKALADMNIFHGLTDVEGQGYPSFLADYNT